MKILFVCTGNSCRSVMAQGLLRNFLARKGRGDVQVISAGTGTMGGAPPTLETVEVMKREGVDVSGHASRPLTPELIRNADAIFCMEDGHWEEVVKQVPEARSKTHLLKTFQAAVLGADPNIPDPIGRPREVYESCLMTVKDAVVRVAQWILKTEKGLAG